MSEAVGSAGNDSSRSGRPLPAFLAEAPRHGRELSVTGKWVPRQSGGRFRRSPDADEMLQEWADIHAGARADDGVLSTEVNAAIGEEAVLIHHVFRDETALDRYFSTTATQHMAALFAVAKPLQHLVRGVTISPAVRDSITAKNVSASFGEWRYGYVRNNYRQPDPETAIQVTAKWKCKQDDQALLAELADWWQQVGTDAHSMEEGLLRFEVYQVLDESALIIHETFSDTRELKFHLTKGTAHKYKKEIDQVAEPDCYFFRGPVAWSIRTYSKFMGLPATYTSRTHHHQRPGGNYSDGIDPAAV